MSLNRKIAAALDNAGAGPVMLDVYDGPFGVTADLAVISPVGFELRSFEFRAARPEGQPYTLDELKAWAERVAVRVTYLMEPLVVLEADSKEVEMRSKTPTPREGARNYFQAVLNRTGTLRLYRLAYDEAAKARRAVPFQVTREVFERLINDLVASSR